MWPFDNTAAKTDRGRMLGGWNGEWSIFNAAMPMGMDQAKGAADTTNTGLGSLNFAKSIYQDLAMGNKTATAAATAPAVNAINTQADAQRLNEAAFGTARGGGTNAANQQAESNRLAQAGNAMFAVRPEAAAGVAKIGETEANVGIQQMSAALRTLGLSEEAIQHIIESSGKSRNDSTRGNPISAIPSVLTNTFLAAFGL